MKKYGLIGRSFAHSQLRFIQALIGEYDYNMIQADDARQLKEILADEEYSGFNVSSPYRTEIIKYLDDLSETARRVGAVNVIKRGSDGRLKGYNTDVSAFRYIARGLVEDKKCIILGTGDAALGCAVALEDLDADEIIMVSRDPDAAADRVQGKFKVIGYNRMHLHYDAEVIINATPVGEIPDIEHSPLADQRLTVRLFSDLKLAIDLIYNPYRTKFLQDARRLTGCRTKSGLEMLVIEALDSRHIWEGTRTDPEELSREVRAIKRKILEEQLNIVAIGMPGSGKTTILRRYAYELGLEFIDTDEETEKLLNDTIPNVLSSGESGMEYFREMEHIAVREACRHRGAVIATGGGTVLNPLNRDYLRSNGIVLYIRRPLDLLEIKGRPISASRGVSELFGERDRIYRRVSDLSVLNSRIFGAKDRQSGKPAEGRRRGNTYNHELKGFVYYIARKIERYLNEIADNQWT